MTNETVYLVWLEYEHDRQDKGIITADQKQSFIDRKAKTWNSVPWPINIYGVLSSDKEYGYLRSQTGKTLATYWFEPVVINEHCK